MNFSGDVPDAPKGRMYNNGHWLFPEAMGTGVGFVYIIRDKYFENFYLGIKNFRVMSGRYAGTESDWRKYISSSKLLQELLFERPKEEFEFVCLETYKTKGALRYAETWSLCHVDAPLHSNWYNTRIEKITWSVTEAVTQRHRDRLRQVTSGVSFLEEKRGRA